jgi:hypothetical protein
MNQTREAHHSARPLHVGWWVAEVRRRLDDPPVEILLSVVTGYAAYLPAEMELQKARDTTAGPEKPLGERDAHAPTTSPKHPPSLRRTQARRSSATI